jgi:HSP20 family protein
MTLTRWKPLRDLELMEPLREMENLQHEMNRLFDRWMHTGNGETKGFGFIPSVEMEETDEAVRLKLEVPGLEAKDLDVEVTDDAVSIKGERKSESKTEEKGMIRSEFHYGSFARVIPLPVHVQNDKVTAEYKNGVLNLTLPKLEEEKRKTVKVNLE